MKKLLLLALLSAPASAQTSQPLIWSGSNAQVLPTGGVLLPENRPVIFTESPVNGGNTVTVNAATNITNNRAWTIPNIGTNQNFLGDSGSQVITNKTIDCALNTCSNIPGTGITGLVPLANGGTNKNNSAVAGAVAFSDATTIGLTAAGTSGQYLKSAGTGTPVWSAVDLSTASVTGVLPLANGGTNKNMTAVAGGVVWTDADSQEVSAAGTASQWILSGGTAAPTMSNTTTTAKTVDGSADAVQLTVQGNATQTSDIFVSEKSDGTDIFKVSNSAVTVGIATTGNGNGAPHVINGGWQAGNVTSTDSSGTLFISSNAYLSGSAAAQTRTDTTTGGAIVEIGNRASNSSSAFRIYTNQAAATTTTDATAKFLIRQNGALLVGPIDVGQLADFENSNATPGSSDIGIRVIFNQATNATNGQYMRFADNDTTTTGSIAGASATTVAFNTSSDSRLKHNVIPFPGGITTVKAMEAYCFDWNEDDHHDCGVIAQRMKVAYPYAVMGSPDSDPREAPMQVDYGKLTPPILAGLKETISRLEDLEAEFSAYKAAHP